MRLLAYWSDLPGALAQTAEELRRSNGDGDVLTHGMGYGVQRYSTLNQVNRENVRRLVPRWAYALDDDRGQEAQPLVRDGVIYFTTHNATMAVNALTGRQLWKDTIEYPPEMARLACCGILNRGAAMLDDALFRATLDAHVMAPDELVQAKLRVDERPRKVIMQANRNGFFCVLDRTDGKLIAANPFVTVNWADRIDLQTGRPVDSAVTRAMCTQGGTHEVWPSALGGKTGCR